MSEEAVRQTRSQKRALEKDVDPQSIETSDADNESKKSKLDPSEPSTEEQTEPEPDSGLTREGQGQTTVGPEPEKEKEQGLSPPSLALPLASQPVKDDQERTQRTMAEPSSDNRTDCSDTASEERAEPAVDTKSQVPLAESKVPSSMLAAAEVKATIKVEVQMGEQPMDMSTSRG